MQSDERAIRDLVARWKGASARGDLDAILPLMAEDVVFFVYGHPPMRGREAFTAAFRSVAKKKNLDASGDIEEITISGDMAYCVSWLEVTETGQEQGTSSRRSGYVLSVLRKQSGGNWVIARDANLLAPESRGGS